MHCISYVGVNYRCCNFVSPLHLYSPSIYKYTSLYLGKLHGDALAYMKGLLRHERWLGYTSFGFGLPPASIVHAKVRRRNKERKSYITN